LSDIVETIRAGVDARLSLIATAVGTTLTIRATNDSPVGGRPADRVRASAFTTTASQGDNTRTIFGVHCDVGGRLRGVVALRRSRRESRRAHAGQRADRHRAVVGCPNRERRSHGGRNQRKARVHSGSDRLDDVAQLVRPVPSSE